jgi:hypothetical protein
LGCRLHSPPVKAVSRALSEWAANQFSLTVFESTGALVAYEFIRHMWKEFRRLLLLGQRLGFPRLFMSHQGLSGCRIHSPLVKAVSGVIFEWAASQFSLIIYESTGAVSADESIRHL